MMLQLDPMLPVYVPKFKMEGYAFLVTKESQEHYTIFTVAMDNGEVWDLSNREVRFCKNYSADRPIINTGDTIFKDAFRPSESPDIEGKVQRTPPQPNTPRS